MREKVKKLSKNRPKYYVKYYKAWNIQKHRVLKFGILFSHINNLKITSRAHAHGQTFLQSTRLTSTSGNFGDFAILPFGQTLVTQLVFSGPFEEAFATFTANSSKMATRSSISTNDTSFHTRIQWALMSSWWPLSFRGWGQFVGGLGRWTGAGS